MFVTQTRGELLTVVVSRSGRIENERDGTRFLVLEDGRRYDGAMGRPDFRLMEFGRYGLRLEPRSPTLGDQRAKARTTLELLRDPTPRHLGELSWRISLPTARGWPRCARCRPGTAGAWCACASPPARRSR